MEYNPTDAYPDREVALNSVQIDKGFWFQRRKINAETAIFYQWEQLEKTFRLESFRQVAGTGRGRHHGYFYNDSDVHKWAEAAFCIYGDAKALRCWPC